MDPTIRTKIGQAPTDSPRTLESNRRRLGSLFSTLTIGSSDSDPASAENGTPSKSRAAAQGSGWLSWLSPARKSGIASSHGSSEHEEDDLEGKDEDEGCFIDGESLEGSMTLTLGSDRRNTRRRIVVEQISLLYGLPDELLIEILLRLPPSTNQISALSLVSRRFQSLSQSPQLWTELFHSTPGFEILPEVVNRIVATDKPTRGRWNGVEWMPSSSGRPKHIDTGQIPVHFPTLYRSRLALSRTVRCESPSGPPHKVTLRDHTDSVYCVHLSTPWLITGSRDRSIRFWRLANLPLQPGHTITMESKLVQTVDKAHEGSVLSVRFEMNDNGDGGTLVTGSSDMTACIWNVTLEDQCKAEKVGTLRAHTGGVLDVALGKTRIATCSKDTTIRIYDRESHAHLFTYDLHTGPVNCLAIGATGLGEAEQVVSASGDGYWIIWDMISGKEVRRGGGDGRGLACIAWEGDRILTGDNDRLIKLFSAGDSTLVKTFEGHTDLVRSLALDKRYNLIISGSYDQSVRMWDLKTGNMIRRMRGNHSSLIFGVATDRGRVVSVSHDSTIQVLTYGQDLPYRGLFA